ncbi:MAG: hypothetical protein EOO56_03485 [Hymenobacter sp.]|nr:MAG: hypothetical protein EOO56_03485 [Hymenobacter sp.]
MAVFLLRVSFRSQPSGDDFLLAGRVYPAATTIKTGDWLLLGGMKVLIKQVENSAYQGIILTISQDAVETLRRAEIALTKLYGTEIPIESAAQ